MNRKRTILGIVIGLPILLIGLLIIDSAIYPFAADDPKFSDVETAFAKLQFPSDWQEIKSSENRGIAGRKCKEFNTSGCYHKSKTFKVNNITTATDDIKRQFTEHGNCKNIEEHLIPDGNSNTDPLDILTLKCVGTNGVAYLSSVYLKKGELGVTATSSY